MKRKLKDYPDLTLNPESLPDSPDFALFFGRSAPLHIEIGFGKGTFLLSQAKNNPNINFLGIEQANKYYRHTLDRIGRWQLKNVRLIRTDAADFIARRLPADSVDCFHIYFPDPWPKKRHHKRRFFNPQNLDNLLKSLKPGGEIRVATDHEDYFQQIKNLFAASAGVLQEIEFLPAAGVGGSEWVGSNFERKYLKENRPIFTLAVKKIV